MLRRSIDTCFPSELMDKPNWVCWRYHKRGSKRTKRPYHPDGRNAKSNDPSTWSTLEACSAANGFDGVGFMFDGTCFGIDLDHVINPDTGEIDPVASNIIERASSYTELSPSGTGVHILCLGSFPGKGRRAGAVEVYGAGRYFTVTGKPFGEVRPIRDASAEVVSIITDYIDKSKNPSSVGSPTPPTPSSLAMSAEQVIARIRRSKQAQLFKTLYDHGDTSAYGGDDSAADMALCNVLAFWTGRDATLMDEIFRTSALYRSKWDEMHGEAAYGTNTINKAIEDCTDWYGKPRPAPDWMEDQPSDEGSPFHRFEQAYAATYGYRARKGMTYAVKEAKDGSQRLVTLAQFIALPVETIARDDGAEIKREFRIEGISPSGEVLPLVNVPTTRFDAMKWPVDLWGIDAVIEPGQAVKDLLRHAIMDAGNRYARRHTVFSHTGWRKIDGRWCFLHGAGAIGADDVSVELEGALSAYAFPDQAGDMRPSLELLEVLPKPVAIPLLGHVFLAPLCEFMEQAGCPPLYTLFVAGYTGQKKTTSAALALAHFGARFNYSHVPANFHDTAGALRKKAFLLKDAPLLVDDYHPSLNSRQRQVMDSTAQDMARAWGDRVERGRLHSDTTLRNAQPPRGLGIITGEDIPDVGESGAARYFIVDVKRNAVQAGDALTRLQEKARQGALAASMRAFIEWLIPQCDALPDALKAAFEAYRAQARERLTGTHDRQPPAVAWLMVGYSMMLRCMRDKGVLTTEQVEQMTDEAFDVLVSAAQDQRKDMQGESPVELFMNTLEELEASGAVEIAERRPLTNDWSLPLPGAQRVGYRDENYLYLISGAAYGAVNRALQQTGRSFPLKSPRLWKTMAEQGKIITHDGETSKPKAFGSIRSRVVFIPLTPEQKADYEERRVREDKL